jgi:hypothetical protein
MVEALLSNRRGLSIEFPAIATTRAFWRCIAPDWSA